MGENPASPAMSLDRESRLAITAALDQLLDSPDFRHSEQSRRLMRHLVELSLDGTPEQLRERAIGTALFGLDAGYDTAENPIVRVRVNELRKRLGRYYHQAGPVDIRFDIAARGYRVEVVRTGSTHAGVETAAAPPVEATGQPVPTRSGRRWIWAGGALAVAGGVAALLVFSGTGRAPGGSPVDRFWAPALDSGAPVLLCAGHPVVYRLSRDAQQRLSGRPVDHFQGQTAQIQLAPDTPLRGQDIVAIPDQYIGLGSAEAVARISGYLQRHRKDVDIRFGNDLTFTELRKSPAVLIGAFQNRWTVEFMRGMRFVFDTGEGGIPEVKDTTTGRRWWLQNLKENGETPEDYVLISRVLRGANGQFVIAAGGITQYGGRTIGEVLSDSRILGAMLKGASPGWASRNVQLLMKVQIIGKTPGPPELIAVHEW